MSERLGGRITAVTPDPRRPAAVRVAVDGQLYCTVPAEVVTADDVRVGRPLDGALAERLDRAADREAAYRTVLRSLELRSYAEADLTRRLLRKGHPREAAEAAVVRAREAGLLDDAAYAVRYVQTRAARGRGPSRVTRDLLGMGVARPLVDRAVAAEWPEGSDRTATPLALAERRAAQLGELPRPVKRRRVLAYLARRGFLGRDITDMVARVIR